MSYKKAEATGFNFFKSKNPGEVNDLESNSQLHSDVYQSSDLNEHNKLLLIDFERTYTNYTRFNGRHNDENLDFDDTISVLVPAIPATTNCLLF